MSANKVQQQGQVRRKLTEGFKQDAVGVSSRSLREWHEKFAPEPEACGEDASVQQLQEENRRLRKEFKRAAPCPPGFHQFVDSRHLGSRYMTVRHNIKVGPTGQVCSS